MDDLNLLLRKIITQPDEDTYRLAFADEAEARGDALRAHFIRRDIALGSTLTGIEKGRVLTDVKEGYAPWVEPWRGACADPAIVWVFRRGFIEEVTAPAATFLKNADALVWHPSQGGRCPAGCVSLYGVHVVPARPDRPLVEGAARCGVCDGTGVQPPPCPDTAQPVRKVTLVGHPRLHNRRVDTPDRTDDDLWLTDDPRCLKFRANTVWAQMRKSQKFPASATLALLELRFPGVVFEFRPEPTRLVWTRTADGRAEQVEVTPGIRIRPGDLVYAADGGRATTQPSGPAIGHAMSAPYTPSPEPEETM